MNNLDLTKLSELLNKFGIKTEEFVSKFNFDENTGLSDIISFLKEHQMKMTEENNEKKNKIRREKDEYLEKKIKEQMTKSQEILPLVNVIEGDSSVYVSVIAPGLTKDDFKIEIDEYILSISAEYPLVGISDTEGILMIKKHQIEYKLVSFKKEIPLDIRMDINNVSAHYENGILCISVGKDQTPAPKKSIIID